MAVRTQISLFFISLFLSLPAFGQLKPVTVITSLVPPYTPYLGEYANDTGDKLSVTVVLNDSRVESHPIKLAMYLDLVGTGTVARTSPAAVTPIFYLGQGTLQLGGADLAAYFLPQNIDFSGELGQLFSTQGRIPDGLYRIGFHVVDAMRPDVVLSSSGYSPPSWFLLNPPPLPAIPADGEEVALTSIQNVRFSWTPRHLGSGNAAFAAEYTFRLYRMAVAGVGKEQTVLSTFPVYTATTNATSIFMGADDYQLEQGISYAWTVTAGTGEGGFTLFTNGGRSEARSFNYGCLCPVPYAPLPTSVRPTGATIGWEPDPLHMSFETGFRKAGDTEGTWHTVESYLGESSINDLLDPLTSYEFRVRAFCFNGEWSDFSPLNRFTTAEMPKVDIDCGAVDEKVVIANTVPKPMLYAGDVLTYGQWKLVLTEVSGANGIFSGRCDMAVPLLNNAKVRMVFNGITVNELNQVTAGIVRSESSDDSRLFVEDITDYIFEGDQTGNIIDNAAVAGIELGFSGSGGLTASVSGDGSSVTISSGSGSQTFTPDDLDEGTTLKDSDGNIYAVSADGEVTQIGAAGGSSGGSSGSDSAGSPASGASGTAPTSNSASSDNQAIIDPGSLPLHPSASITFSAAGKWALDERDERYSGTPFDAEYLMLGDSFVPWKLVPAGKSDKIRATVSGSGIDPEKVRFIAADGTEFLAKSSGSSIDLEIIGAAAGDGYELFAVYEDPSVSGETEASGETTSTQQASGSGVTGSSVTSTQSSTNQGSQESGYYLLGKLNVASFPLLKRSVMVVPIAGASVDASSLEAAINAVYSGYGVTWDVGVDEAFTDLSWDTDGDGLDGGGSGPFAAYNAEMRALNGSYSAARGVKENTVYLFWFGAPAGDNGALAGDMPLGGPVGYIFAPVAGPEIYNTVAHELGHGAFQLRHTFSDSYNVAQYTTDNLMDYPGGPVLKKYQWDILHDPRLMVAKWSQEEQEGQIAPIIVTILIKAGASFLADFGLQTICAYYFDESCENDWTKAMGEVNWIQVGRSTIEGAIPWKIPGGVLGKAAVTAAGDIIVNFTSTLINPETYTLKDLGVDFMIGFIGQLAGDGISELILKYGESGIKNGLKKLGFNDAFFDKLKVSKISAELLQLKEEALAKFGKNVIQDLDGAYIDNIEDIVIKNGLTMDQFELLIRRPVPGVTIDKTLFPDITPLSEAEATIIRNIRYELIGTLDENTIFEKVITETDATSYMNNNYRFGNTVGGFVSRAQDVKHLNTPEANFYGIRLDYQSSEFLSPDNAGYVIRFTTKEHNKLNIPNINEFPNTGHGFTAGINGYLGIPELQTTGGMELETASIFLIREDGTEELVGILTKDIRTDIKTFKSVN